MRIRTRLSALSFIGLWNALTILGAAPGLLGCAGKAQVTASGDAGLRETRVPAKHRASGSSCPSERGAINPTPVDPMCTPPDSSLCQTLFTCTQDSNCSQGANGRCGQASIGPRHLSCSYDECLSDEDCVAGAACECRAEASDSWANSCLSAGNCRVDADCGDGAYCSPSQINSFCSCLSPALCDPPDRAISCGDACGHGYFCHTATDTCIDDTDCDSGNSCNYDSINHNWSCSYCLPIP
jgi:hypothetical protein